MRHKKRLWVLNALALVAVAWRCAPAHALTLRIAPEGNDSWSGTLTRPNAARTDGPLASLQGARAALRRLKARGPLTEPAHVVVASGTYALREPFVLEPGDSGTAPAPISYEAAAGAHPVFSGGRAITGWQRGDDGIWTARLPGVQAGQWYFEQLWVNGHRATRARTPNTFYLYGAGKARPGDDPTHGDPNTINERAFRARPADIAPLLALSPQQLHDVTVTAYHSWETARLHVAAIDPKTNTLVMSGSTLWGFSIFAPLQRYQIENYKGALDAPGEWFLDRDGTLFYKPLPGEDMTRAQVIAPVTEQFMQLQGQPEQGRFVEHINFKGLSFQHGQYLLPPTGHSDTQAEVSVPAVIMADGARNIAFEDCAIAHIGLYGIWLRRGCEDNRIVHCHLADLGAGGVRLGETEIRANTAERTGHNTVDNNIIQGGGRIHAGAIGVWIGQSGDNAVTHNDIGDLLYTGISVGWTWGYGPSLAQHNTIDFNHIHHIGQGVLGDMGGVYTLGPSPGTTVRHNYLHDIYAYANGAWGLYPDEGSTGIVLEDNLVHDTSGGLHENYGRENIVRNNIFAFGEETQAHGPRDEGHLALTFEHNILYWHGGPLPAVNRWGGPGLSGNWTHNVVTQNNLYWDTAHQAAADNGLDPAQWQATGQNRGSLVADPLFINPAARDFRLATNSPAYRIGFKPFDPTRAGVYGDAAWLQLAQAAPMPPRLVAPPAPEPEPLDVADDFEAQSLGGRPIEATVSVENKGDFIGVTEETAAGGKHSLKIVDAPGLAAAYNPHFYYSPHHRTGSTHCAFDLRVEAGVDMYHEWRDSAGPYRVGPHFSIRNGKLNVNNRELLGLPAGQWTHFEITTRLGAAANGTWDLSVTLPNTPPQHFLGLKFGNPNWNTLDWLGFVSMATTKTVYYLDNFDLENTGRDR